ncbi:MAG: hypothetical protein DMG13_22625 [Acidobacteria bacterium]|nr:MAG: hypothetical protein DMG13_22625 [Acidobacteriota bacterium]
MTSLTREELQAFLDDRKHLSYSMVDHLRWDLKQILNLAIAEGVITRNPAYVPPGTMLLFVPRECPKAKRLVMTVEQAKEAFASLELRERLIVKLAVRVIEFSLDPVKKCLASACEMYVSRAF